MFGTETFATLLATALTVTALFVLPLTVRFGFMFASRILGYAKWLIGRG